MEYNKIVLPPLQTKEEFSDELEAAERDWQKNGGLTLKKISQKYKL
ncbi:MAG: hypothetical protein WC843_02725 [Candidatus Gracilibacteria bacterium]|jgi:hypothetical protein